MSEYSKEKLAELDNNRGSIEHNKRMWDDWDWSEGGEEWNRTAQRDREIDPSVWKQELIDKMMFKYIEKNSTVLEIGSGAGRWSAELVNVAAKLILADISPHCLEMCKKRFHNHSNVQYQLITTRLDFIEADSIDYIWSFDAFVHVNPSLVYDYVEDFKRILKPGGIAIIHHAGERSLYTSKHNRDMGMRSNMDQHIMSGLIHKNNLTLIEQNFDVSAKIGDVVTVFTKK